MCPPPLLWTVEPYPWNIITFISSLSWSNNCPVCSILGTSILVSWLVQVLFDFFPWPIHLHTTYCGCRCDECDKCYHFECLHPPVKKSPKVAGYSWACSDCAPSDVDTDWHIHDLPDNRWWWLIVDGTPDLSTRGREFWNGALLASLFSSSAVSLYN